MCWVRSSCAGRNGLGEAPTACLQMSFTSRCFALAAAFDGACSRDDRPGSDLFRCGPCLLLLSMHYLYAPHSSSSSSSSSSTSNASSKQQEPGLATAARGPFLTLCPPKKLGTEEEEGARRGERPWVPCWTGLFVYDYA